MPGQFARFNQPGSGAPVLRLDRDKGMTDTWATMMLPTVFIGSSTEGHNGTLALQRLLHQDLLGKVQVVPWTHGFQLGATTIESLEKYASRADFAILLLTADDDLTIREEETRTPRDNVMFELGLFMGALGRQRCYMIKEGGPLRLASDLLGINHAVFQRPASGNWDDSLAGAVSLVVGNIAVLGRRERTEADFVATQARVRTFSARAQGYWWERIKSATDDPWLSIFRIMFDPIHNSVRLVEGRAHDPEGRHGSNWFSKAAHVSINDNRIDYLWEGTFTPPRATGGYHGFGTIHFDEPHLREGGPFVSASGSFSDVDEAHPEKTGLRAFELRRVVDHDIATMTTASERARSELVRRVLANW